MTLAVAEVLVKFIRDVGVGVGPKGHANMKKEGTGYPKRVGDSNLIGQIIGARKVQSRPFLKG